MGRYYEEEPYQEDIYPEDDLGQEFRRVSKDVVRVGGKAIKRGASKMKSSVSGVSSGGLLVAKILKVLAIISTVIGVIGFFGILFSKPDASMFGNRIDSGLGGAFFMVALMYLLLALGIALGLFAAGFSLEYLYFANVRLDRLAKLTVDTNEILFYQNEVLEKTDTSKQ